MNAPKSVWKRPNYISLLTYLSTRPCIGQNKAINSIRRPEKASNLIRAYVAENTHLPVDRVIGRWCGTYPHGPPYSTESTDDLFSHTWAYVSSTIITCSVLCVYGCLTIKYSKYNNNVATAE